MQRRAGKLAKRPAARNAMRRILCPAVPLVSRGLAYAAMHP
jgi:hypothetical protein